jgi:endonuclease/exonuclease/phosphatase family metal-dependent hydrolase
VSSEIGPRGIGGYDLADARDRVFGFDHTGSGRLDHLVLYRPGAGTIWILKNSGGTFSAVYAKDSGIGGYDLAEPADRVFAFDYNGSGKQDHLALYRPGFGTIWILKNTGGSFAPVYAEGSPGRGIGGYDLAEPADRVLAFDYAGSGKQNQLILYRPGTGAIWILKNSGGAFSAVWKSPRAGDMRVLVWNIGGGAADGGSGHTPKVIEVLRKWSADIQLLQEVNRDQVEPLKNALQAHAVFGPDPRGDMIISRWPFLAWQLHSAPMRKIRNPQTDGWLWHTIWGRIAYPDRPMHLLSVHYPLRGDGPADINPPIKQWTCSLVNLVRAAKKVREVILDHRRSRPDPVILGGDFNGASVNVDCSPRDAETDECYDYFPPPHCENVDVLGTARLYELWPLMEGAAFSTPTDSGLSGFVVNSDWPDWPAAAIAEHPPVIYEVTGPAPRSNPFGSLDSVSSHPEGVRVAGWAIDPDTAAPIDVHVYVDGTFAAGRQASLSRPDVGAAYPEYGGAHGFDFVVSAPAGRREVCVTRSTLGRARATRNSAAAASSRESRRSCLTSCRCAKRPRDGR